MCEREKIGGTIVKKKLLHYFLEQKDCNSRFYTLKAKQRTRPENGKLCFLNDTPKKERMTCTLRVKRIETGNEKEERIRRDSLCPKQSFLKL